MSDSQNPLPPTDTLSSTLHLHDVTIYEVWYRMTRQVQELNSLDSSKTLSRDAKEREWAREMNCRSGLKERRKSNPKHHSASIDTHSIANECAINNCLGEWILLPDSWVRILITPTLNSPCVHLKWPPTSWKDAVFLLSSLVLFFNLLFSPLFSSEYSWFKAETVQQYF